jgi:hypothetical protein
MARSFVKFSRKLIPPSAICRETFVVNPPVICRRRFPAVRFYQQRVEARAEDNSISNENIYQPQRAQSFAL